MKYSMTISILLFILNQNFSQAQIDFCYVIDERNRELIRVAQDGSQYATIAQIQETSVEAIAWDRIGDLWMFDAGTAAFYTLDLATGTSTFKHAAPSAIRSDDGSVHQIKDVDAMDFDAFNSNIIWCVERIPGPDPDLFFSFDVTTGLVIGGIVFPVVMIGKLNGGIFEPVTGIGYDIDGIGVDPLTGTTYAIANNDGTGDCLVVIDNLSGDAFGIGRLLDQNGVQINDMEGFGFDVDGQLIGTTGRDGTPDAGALYFISKGTGEVELLSTINCRDADFESIACFNSRLIGLFYTQSSYCTEATVPTPRVIGLGNGSFSATPNGLVIDASTGNIDASTSILGVYTISYTTASTVYTVSVAITDLDDASFSYSETSYCTDECTSTIDPRPNITGIRGGTFSVSPSGLIINASTGAIDAAGSLPGDYTVSYITIGACPNSSDVSVAITGLADDASFSYTQTSYCKDANVLPPMITGLAGGTFNASPVGLIIDAYSGAIDAAASQPGDYTITYKTTGACINSSIAFVTITAFGSTVSVTASETTSVLCNGDATGVATAVGAGGTSPLTYAWSSGGSSAVETGLSAGTYSVVVTDANGCFDNATVTITEPVLTFTVTTSTVAASCVGVADGSATAIASGAGSFSYSWSNNGSGPTITNIPAGNYTVTISQSPSGCSIIETVVVPSFGGITWATGFPAAIDETCVGDHDGAVGALAIDGTAPYTYNWEDTAGNPLSTISGLAPGTYFVTATDTDGCTVSGSATVNPGITLNWANGPSAINTTCPGADDGSVLAIADGGAAPYTYDWDDSNGNSISIGGFIGNGGNDNTAGLSPGTYCVTATDVNGCTISGCATIVDGAGLTWSTAPTATDESCLGANDGAVFASIAGATSYVWTDAMGNPIGTSGLAGGSYFVVATDANGCTISGTTTVAPGEFEYTMPNGNMLTGTQSATEDYEVDGAIESDQLVNGGAGVNVDYDSGTCITLKAGFEVVSSSVFHAFIDGCGGSMLRQNEDNSDQK